MFTHSSIEGHCVVSGFDNMNRAVININMQFYVNVNFNFSKVNAYLGVGLLSYMNGVCLNL